MFIDSSVDNESNISPFFELRYPDINTHSFDPEHNEVRGKIELKFLRTASNIVSIDIGFRGESEAVQTRVLDPAPQLSPTSSVSKRPLTAQKAKKFVSRQHNSDKNKEIELQPTKEEYSRRDCLFHESKNVFRASPTEFPEGYFLEYPFDYSFPKDKPHLPTSCNSFGTDSDNISIKYQIYVRVQYFASLEDELPISLDFIAPLKFQGSSLDPIHIDDYDNTIDTKVFDISDSFLYKDKWKVFLPDPILGGIITNTNRGISAKFIKKHWGSNYAKTITRSSDIDLHVFLGLTNPLNLLTPVGNLPIRIEARAPGVLPSDLCFNEMSTKLGYFEIEVIDATMLQHVNILVDKSKSGPYHRIIETCVFKERFSNKPSFDLKDLEYNEQEETYVLNTTLSHFLGDTSTTFFEKINKTNPVMNSIELSDYFKCENTLRFSIRIGSGQPSSPKRQNVDDIKRTVHTFSFTLPSINLYVPPTTATSSLLKNPVKDYKKWDELEQDHYSVEPARYFTRVFDPNKDESDLNQETIGARIKGKSGAALGAVSGFAMGVADVFT